MNRFRWLASGILGAALALLVGFRVETTSGGWAVSSLPEWLFYLQARMHPPPPLPMYSAPYWAAGGFLIGALWIALRQRD